MTAGVLGLTLIVNLAAWCPCASAASAAKPESAHGCCAPAGLQAASDDCCSGKAPASSATAPEASAPAFSLLSAPLARWTDTTPAILTTAAPPVSRVPLPTVLRI